MMRLYFTTILLSSLLIICFSPLVSNADSDDVSVRQECSPPKKIRPEPAVFMSVREKLEMEAEAAADAGYQDGDTVKIEDGIIYRLFRNPVTECYTFQLFRQIKKPDSPSTVEGDENTLPGTDKSLGGTDGKKTEQPGPSKNISDTRNEMTGSTSELVSPRISDDSDKSATENNTKPTATPQDAEAIGLIMPNMTDDKPSLEKSPQEKKDNRELPPVPDDDKEKKTHPPGKEKNVKKIFA